MNRGESTFDAAAGFDVNALWKANKGWGTRRMGFVVSQVPKCEGPGAPEIAGQNYRNRHLVLTIAAPFGLAAIDSPRRAPET
jgi:hypothetical protein